MVQSVVQEWQLRLPLQQQSVLLLACRGPDGIGKSHHCKDIIRRYRACVLTAAYSGRPMRVDECDPTSFMSLANFSDAADWELLVKTFLSDVDSIPLHYFLHLVHGGQIIGYKHPEELFRSRWQHFYLQACECMHVVAESEAAMDGRLSDWSRAHWS